MRVDAVLEMTAQAEYWTYTVTQDPIDGTNKADYNFDRIVNLIITERNGLPLAFCRELLAWNTQLRNIKDVAGTQIFEDNKVAYLGSPIAQFDVFGSVIGYKYTLSMQAGGN
jgi:hypothetical protein